MDTLIRSTLTIAAIIIALGLAKSPYILDNAPWLRKVLFYDEVAAEERAARQSAQETARITKLLEEQAREAANAKLRQATPEPPLNSFIQRLPKVTVTAARPVDAEGPRYIDRGWAKQKECEEFQGRIHRENTAEEISQWCLDAKYKQ